MDETIVASSAFEEDALASEELIVEFVEETVTSAYDTKNGSSSSKVLNINPVKKSNSQKPKNVAIDVTSPKISSTNKSLKPIAPNTSKIISPIASSSFGAHKILLPASSIKTTPTNVKPITTIANVNQSNALQTPAYLAGAGVVSFIMVPAHLLKQNETPSPVISQISTKVNQIPSKVNQSSIKVNQTMKPTSIVKQEKISAATSTSQRTSFIPIAPSPLTQTSSSSHILAGLTPTPKLTQNGSKLDNDSNRPRKPCNCTKSQCLKLYCDCFANGEFCNACNCINCANNLKHEEERQKAIRQCLERNPQAFHPKIGKGRGDITERRHTKGCNCRRSGCLKNYCECYEAKILCAELCKCVACKNYEDSFERKTLMHLADAAEVRSAQQSVASKSQLCGNDFRAKLPVLISERVERIHCSFITSEVIEATCECLLAQAEHGLKQKMSQTQIEKLILEEFGRCLRQIIEVANHSKN